MRELKTWLMEIKSDKKDSKHMQKEMIKSEIVSDVGLAVTIGVFFKYQKFRHDKSKIWL